VEQQAGKERTLTTHDLRDLHCTVVQGLLCGQSFTVLYAGQPLARLLSLRPVPSVLTLPDPQVHAVRLKRLEALLGQTDLARVLGLTLTTFLIRRPEVQFFQATLDRLETLSGILDDLETTLSPARIKPWFLRANKELKGVSILTTLAYPWRPGDTTITLVKQLARRERVQSLNPAPSSRHRT